MGWLKNLFGGGNKNPEKIYKQALDLFGKEKFRDAATLLEETAELNPNSAPVHFTLGMTYFKITGEYGEDEEKIQPWMKKSRDSYKKAVDLAATSGGLNEKQLSNARDFVIAFDRITEKNSPSVPEEDRMRIFADFMETHATELLLGTNIAQQFGAASNLADMMQSLKRNTGKADTATYAKIVKKYSLSEGQLRAIVEEGKQKKWPFKGEAN